MKAGLWPVAMATCSHLISPRISRIGMEEVNLIYFAQRAHTKQGQQSYLRGCSVMLLRLLSNQRSAHLENIDLPRFVKHLPTNDSPLCSKSICHR